MKAEAKFHEFTQRYKNWTSLREDEYVIRKSFLSNKKIIVSHTTIDLIKIHNTLVDLGLRHIIKLGLTSHCPELPALEDAESAMSEGLEQSSTSNFFCSSKKN